MGNCLKGNENDESSLIRVDSGPSSFDTQTSSSQEVMSPSTVEPGRGGAMPQCASVTQRNEEEIKAAKCLGILQHLPVEEYVKEKDNAKECVICMIEFNEGDKIRYLPCMHTYHMECIDDWLMRSFTCPSCLEPVDSALFSTFGQMYDSNELWPPSS